MQKSRIMYVSGRVLTAILVVLMLACVDNEVAPVQDENDALLSQKSTDDSAARKYQQETFTAHLTGDQELGDVETGGSGQAILKLSKDGMSLSYKIIVNNVANMTQAHIHCGGPEVNGPVVAFLFGFVAGGVTMNGVLAEGVITPDDVIARPDSNECMGGVANFEQLIEKLRTGSAYVNVHTVAYPGGEIRGAIK